MPQPQDRSQSGPIWGLGSDFERFKVQRGIQIRNRLDSAQSAAKVPGGAAQGLFRELLIVVRLNTFDCDERHGGEFVKSGRVLRSKFPCCRAGCVCIQLKFNELEGVHDSTGVFEDLFWVFTKSIREMVTTVRGR